MKMVHNAIEHFDVQPPGNTLMAVDNFENALRAT
jgi:hypothetical protein